MKKAPRRGKPPGGPTFDALLLGTVARGLGRALDGSQLQKIHEPEPGLLVLRVHPSVDKRPLVIRARAGGYVALADPGLENPPEPSAFCMLLRKHLEGARVLEVRREGTDRVLTIVTVRGPANDLEQRKLVVELLGPRANLHLLGDGDRILGSRRRYPADRERFEGGTWRPPRAREAAGPCLADATDAELAAALGRAEGRPEIADLPPAPGRLAAALEAAETGRGVTFLAGLRDPEAWTTGPFCLVKGARRPLVVAGARPELEGHEVHEFPTLWELLEEAFLVAGRRERDERARRELLRGLERGLGRIRRQLEKNTQGLEECERADEVRALGELLKVNLRSIERGAREVTLTDYSSGEAVEVTVPLDPKKKPAANMDRYFDRARRLRMKQPILERKRRHLEDDLAHLEELLARGRDPDEDASALKEEVRALGLFELGAPRPGPGKGKGKGPGKKGKKKLPDLRTFVSSDGLRILVGRSNKENDLLVRRVGSKGDAWLHAEGVPGAHVLVKLPNGGGRPPEATLREAAQLAAHFSKSRYEKKAKVMLAPLEKVKRPANSPPGVVTLDSHESILVPTDSGVVRKLKPPGR